MIGKYFPKISHFLLNSKEIPIYMNIRAIRHIIKSTVFVDITIANGRKASFSYDSLEFRRLKYIFPHDTNTTQ